MAMAIRAKEMIVFFIVLVVLVAAVIVALTQLGSAIKDEKWEDVKTLLAKNYNESEVVAFSVGGLDEQNLKIKLTSNFSSVGELYSGNTINSNVLFGSARIETPVEFNKKDLTLITKSFLLFTILAFNSNETIKCWINNDSS